MEPFYLNILIYVACGVASGLLIGAVGIGGVILVPLLVFAAGADIYQSIAASIFSFMVSGSVGTFIYAKRKVISWKNIKFLWLGAAPSTLVGTFMLSFVSKEILIMLIGGLTIASAAWEFLAQKGKSEPDTFHLERRTYIFFGLVAGFLSALSGTGGPLVLIPIMLWFSVPITTAIGFAQSIQLPISLFATIGNAWNGILDLSIAIPIASGVAFGTYFGNLWIKGVPAYFIRKGVATFLMVIGLALTVSSIFEL